MDEAALHELLSGRNHSLGARLLRGGLHLGSWGYFAASSLRNLAYSRNWLPIHKVPVPVISIGNITTGGTGKTPFAAWIANWLTSAGHRPGLLSRGYRSLDGVSSADANQASHQISQGNDEKLVLDRLCLGVPHLQQRDRVTSAQRMVHEFRCDVLLLDDGFQHRRLHRDLDLVLIDSLQPWGYGHILPRGLLRESLSGLRRADVVVLTRVNQCPPDQRQALRTQLSRSRGSDDCVEVAFVPRQLVDQHWQPEPLGSVAGKKAFAFCAIGNPAGFRQTVASLGVNADAMQTFPDHHHYQAADLVRLSEQAQQMGADVVLTTQKDLVKIAPDAWKGPPLFAVEIGVEFVSQGELLEASLRELFVP